MGDLGDAGRERGRHAGVDRVAAPRQHAHPRLGREVPSCRHDADATDDLRPIRGGAEDPVDERSQINARVSYQPGPVAFIVEAEVRFGGKVELGDDTLKVIPLE